MSKTVFILGAGASHSHSNKEFPLVNDIFKVAKKLSVTTRIKSINTLSLDYECVEKYINKKFGKSILDSRQKIDIEDILTNLEIDIEKIRTNKLQIIRNQIIKMIFNTFSILTNKSFYNKGNNDYFSFYNNKLKANDTVITYNWDLLLDNILNREELIHKTESRSLYGNFRENIPKAQYLNMLINLSGYRDYNNERINAPYKQYHSKGYYLKLHGSIDWLYCPNEDCGLYSKVFPVKDIMGEYSCSECSSTMKQLIIPPLLNKNYSSFPFVKKLWNIASEELKLADELVIWGYSLPATDFYNRWLFRQTSDRLKKIAIINPECFRKGKNKDLKSNNKFLGQFLDIFKINNNIPEILYYENYSDYNNNIKYLDKYK